MRDRMTRVTYMLIAANLAGGSFWDNQEAVDTAISRHPAWDLTEMKSWDEWEAEA